MKNVALEPSTPHPPYQKDTKSMPSLYMSTIPCLQFQKSKNYTKFLINCDSKTSPHLNLFGSKT